VNVSAIARLFPNNPDGEEAAVTYLKGENLFECISAIYDSQKNRIKPKYRDLARLHKIVMQRKVFSAVEFGVGFSTIVIADALQKNRHAWELLRDKPSIRYADPFKLYSVDAGKAWIEATKRMLPAYLKEQVHFHISEVKAGEYCGKYCHYYDNLPDVVPDFLYIDGPDPTDVKGSLRGIAWKNAERVVMSGDLLALEPLFLPGALVLIDGRTLNGRFVSAHLFRNWSICRSEKNDVTVFELQEKPLGKLNGDILDYQLEGDANSWPEPLNRGLK
jgi:hypothetical protein